jgi:glycosyltransferase involved in cell wall biosynthesis
MPYFCHPDFYRLRLHETVPQLRAGERTVRVFFAGTADDAKYDRQFAFPLATRSAILRAVTAALADDLTTVRTRSALAAARDGAAQRLLFALSGDTDDTTDRHLMTPGEYIALMARADFFLAPPGWVMPHCHNIVEAMSVGTIPITNYGGYLTPPLEDGVTCLAFDAPDGAVAAVRRALAMPAAEIAAMRANVVRYHDEHLAAPAFRRRLDRQAGVEVTVRVNAERGR